MKDTVRVGVIGTGQIAQTHLKHYSNIPEVEVVACADINFAGLTPTLGSVYVVNCKIPAVAPGLRGLAIQTLDGFTDMVSLYVSN